MLCLVIFHMSNQSPKLLKLDVLILARQHRSVFGLITSSMQFYAALRIPLPQESNRIAEPPSFHPLIEIRQHPLASAPFD